MIVGEQKPLDEIWGMIKDHKKVLIFGCNTCVAVCQQGGNKEAEVMASMLRMPISSSSFTNLATQFMSLIMLWAIK